MKKLTKEWRQEKRACTSGMCWFMKQNESNTATVLRNLVEEDHNDWAKWTIVRMMNKKQKVQYAIFAAELVLKIFEDEYPDDKRPRKAIEAAKTYIKTPCKRTKDAAANAANAAAYAANAANAAAYAAKRKLQIKILKCGMRLLNKKQ